MENQSKKLHKIKDKLYNNVNEEIGITHGYQAMVWTNYSCSISLASQSLDERGNNMAWREYQRVRD
jgi:hypothetical protein